MARTCPSSSALPTPPPSSPLSPVSPASTWNEYCVGFWRNKSVAGVEHRACVGVSLLVAEEAEYHRRQATTPSSSGLRLAYLKHSQEPHPETSTAPADVITDRSMRESARLHHPYEVLGDATLSLISCLQEKQFRDALQERVGSIVDRQTSFALATTRRAVSLEPLRQTYEWTSKRIAGSWLGGDAAPAAAPSPSAADAAKRV